MTNEKSEKPTTYVLCGYDMDKNDYDGRPDCKVIHYSQHENILNAIKQIKPPANVILECHGTKTNYKGDDGIFVWRENEGVFYSDLFAALKQQGVDGGTMVISCLGGSAETKRILKHAPEGALVLTSVSASSINFNDFVLTKGVDHTRPVDMFLSALQSFDAHNYKPDANDLEDIKEFHLDYNPMHVLPHILGIGGKVPIMIDLDKQVRHLDRVAINQPEGADAWNKAILRTQTIFDSYEPQPLDNALSEDTKKFILEGRKKDQKELADRVASIVEIADKLKKGIPLDCMQRGADAPNKCIANAMQKSIVYALVTAYLDESNYLEIASKMQKGDMHFPNVTMKEQHYLDYVKEKLDGLTATSRVDPKELHDVFIKLAANAVKTDGDDLIPKGGEIDKKLRSYGVDTKGWTR